MKSLTLFIFLTIILTAQLGSASEVLRIGTMDLPPYGWKSPDGKRGLVYELNQEIGIRSGMKFTNTILPFKRMLHKLANGEIDLISSQAHEEALAAGEKLSVQFLINVIAGTKKDSQIEFINDFKGSSLVYHHAASYPQLEGVPQKIHRVNTYRQVVAMVHQREEIDGGVFSEPAYYYWMKDLELTPEDFGRTIIIEQAKKQWILVRKDMPVNLREKLKKIVNEIYNEKMYEKLLLKYGKPESIH